jgi:hypothetical protein
VEGAVAKVEGIGVNVEAEVRCFPIIAYLCGGGGFYTFSISPTKCVSIGSGTSSSDSPSNTSIVKILCNCKEYSYPLSWIKIKYIYY